MNSQLYKQITTYSPYDEKEVMDKKAILSFMKNGADYLTRENRLAHFTTSAWITNRERTKILMIYHNIYDSWSWVGGHADGDENLFRVVKKEITEETGLTKLKPLVKGIYGINIIGVANHIKNGEVINSHLHLDVEYLFEADERDTVRIKPDENSGIKWINIAEIDACVTEKEMKPIYQRCIKKLFELGTNAT